MIPLRNSTGSRSAFVAALIVLVTISAPAAPERISPLHTKADFLRSSSSKPWSAFVVTPGGSRAYKLFFEPEYDLRRVLVGVNLVLSDARDRGSGSNLLNPPHNWHGLQPYAFVANDFLQGPDESTFGAHRTIKVEGRGIVVQIDVLNVRVSPVAGGGHQIGEIKLSVTVDNSNP